MLKINKWNTLSIAGKKNDREKKTTNKTKTFTNLKSNIERPGNLLFLNSAEWNTLTSASAKK